MKRISILVLAAFAASALSPLRASADLKIGVVNMKRIFDEYYKTREAKTKLDDFRAGIVARDNEKVEDLKKMTEDLTKLREESESAALAEDVRKEKRKRYEEKLQQFQQEKNAYNQFRDRAVKDMMDEETKVRTRILDLIREEIRAIRKEQNFDLIFDRGDSATGGMPAVIEAKEEFDITDLIIKRLNDKRPVALPTDQKPVEPKPAAAPEKK